MKLSTKGRYGTRVLLDLALYQGKTPVSLKDIAQRQEIPLAYLKRLIGPLITGGLMRSVRGVGGGVLLAKPPAEITLAEIIELLEGNAALVECINNPEVCERSEWCAARDIWSELDRAANGILKSTTLQDLVDRQRKKEQSAKVMYYI
ncbi:MAG TPA: Rrf2 family transcriptional regulator [Dehalococcoidia bacterium]|jgi:Rrf2 family protein|nr:Rrf2 family transcriptional regulator [Dehalococcoidia bacterium]